MQSVYAQKMGRGWFAKYRDEIGRVTAFAFHHTDWSYRLWEQMELCDTFEYVETQFISKEDVRQLIHHQRKWQMENEQGPSAAFPPETISEFVDKVAFEFEIWFSSLTK